jgi:hypothetical protein
MLHSDRLASTRCIHQHHHVLLRHRCSIVASDPRAGLTRRERGGLRWAGARRGGQRPGGVHGPHILHS